MFDEKPASRRRPQKVRRQVQSAAREALPPVAPPDLRQETALWLCGQRSIEAQRRGRYVDESVQHPGKMWPDVAGAIIDTYTQPGQILLDPMGGIGTTAVEAAERGRHVVMVEIVPRWADVARRNAELTASRGAPGTIQVIQGDARRLPELVASAFDHLVTSPPYGEALESRSWSVADRVQRLRRLIDEGVLDPTVHNSFAGRITRQGEAVAGQAGFLASIAPTYTPAADAVVTSPPYGPTQTGRGMALTGINGDGRPPVQRGIGVPYDAVVTSPPYGPAVGNGGGIGIQTQGPRPGEWADYAAGKGPSPGWRGYQRRAYASRNHDGLFDTMVTSPAYGDIRQDGGAHQFGERSAMTNYTGEDRIRRGRDRTNVGNLRYGRMEAALALIARLRAGEEIPESEWPAMEYLETMALIYWHCLHLVRPGGLAVLVLKDYRREKARVNLVGDTIRIMTEVGWIYHDQALALTSRIDLDGAGAARVVSKVSPFVRINARKPERNGGPVLLPAGEVVLVFRKPT